jgi:hypothetical protein
MSSSSPDLPGWRILGFGKHPEIAVSVQASLRSLGLQAKIIALTNDAAGDARLIEELLAASYDGVTIGGFINGQDPVAFPGTPETTAWFNRMLNIIHEHAPPTTKIILVRGPQDAAAAIERVLGKPLPHPA